MNGKYSFALLLGSLLAGLSICNPRPVLAADAIETNGPAPSLRPARAYVLAPNDLLLVKVYRQDDLESRLRLTANGTATFPLLGTITLGGKTLEEATTQIRDLLDKDYLVNPQVTLTILEYAKRRFTVLGQVQRPGTFEIPGEESVDLLEAIAMGGGFTRLANSSKITVTRNFGGKKSNFTVDARTITDGSDSRVMVMPEDTITVPQRIL